MTNQGGREIYLDCAASTACDPLVVEAMMPFLTHEFSNPSSPHRAARRSHAAIEDARASVAQAIGSDAAEIFFTSGATESNNLALLGACRANTTQRNKIVTTAVEHKSVLATCDELSRIGYEVSYCPVLRDGQVSLGELTKLIDNDTFIVSIQAANNELGTIQPVFEVGQLAHSQGCLVHCDAAQAFGKIPMSVEAMGLDLVSISAHKCYGPKGVGALFVRGGAAHGYMCAAQFGGGQERGLRPGTSNVPAIVGFGAAAHLARERLTDDARRVSALRDRIEEALLAKVEGARRNGAKERRLPGLTSLTFPGADADAIIANAPDVALSSSSACTSGAQEPSHVLQAIGMTRVEAYQTVRIGVGRFNNVIEIDAAASRIESAVVKIRSLSGDGSMLVPQGTAMLQ